MPALTLIGGVLVQLVEIPGLIGGASEDRGGGRALLGVLRGADAIVYCCRASADPSELEVVRDEVVLAGIDKPSMLAATQADNAGDAARSGVLGTELEELHGGDELRGRREEPEGPPWEFVEQGQDDRDGDDGGEEARQDVFHGGSRANP